MSKDDVGSNQAFALVLLGTCVALGFISTQIRICSAARDLEITKRHEMMRAAFKSCVEAGNKPDACREGLEGEGSIQ